MEARRSKPPSVGGWPPRREIARTRLALVRSPLLGWALLVALPLLVGCGDPLERQLDDYRTRVIRVTGVPEAELATTASPVRSYPRPRERLLETEEVRVGLVSSFSLRRCGLQELVGERNSGLGRTWDWSARLVYEARFLDRATACLEELDRSEEAAADLAGSLESWVELKRRQLPAVLWNATVGSEELAAQLSAAQSPPPLDDVADYGRESADALVELAAIAESLRGDAPAPAPPDRQRLDRLLGTVRSERFAGGALVAIDRLTRDLEAVASALEWRQRQSPSCRDPATADAAAILRTVFGKFYVGGLQPYLARLHGDTRDWLSVAERLWRPQLDVAPPAMAEWLERHLDSEAEDGVWRRFDAAIVRHTRAWGALFDSCGWSVGPEPAT